MKRLLLAGTLAAGFHILFLSMDAEWMKKEASYRSPTGPITLALSYKQPEKKQVPMPQKRSEDTLESPIPKRKEEKKVQPKPETPNKPTSIPLATQPPPSEKEKELQSETTSDMVLCSANQPVPDDETVFPSNGLDALHKEASFSSREEENPVPSLQNIREATPRYRENPPPKYPTIARKRGYQGVVILEVLVDQEGRAEKIRISQSSGYSVLDKAAMNSVKKNWVFDPGIKGGKRVEMWVEVPIRFALE